MQTCSNGNQFQFNTTNPSDSWQISVHQQMIGFIIETPLTNNQGRTNILQKKRIEWHFSKKKYAICS